MAKHDHGKPLLIRDGHPPLELERIAVSPTGTGAYDERYIQRLAFEHPGCLPVDEIDRAYEGLVPICMELRTAVGPLDALYVTPAGRLAILEAKLWRNPEARRKVVAQILDYAKELSGWDYEDLQREVSRHTGRKGNALYDIVASTHPETDEAQFHDEVQRSLRHGRFLLLIVGDGIREGAAALASFLDDFGNLEFTFGLVELALYQHAEVGTLVQPRVISRSVEYRRSVVVLPEGASLRSPQAEEPDGDEDAAARRAFYRTFWTELLDELRLDDASQPPANATASTNINFLLPPPGSGSWISAYFSKSSGAVGVFLRLGSGNFADKIAEHLEDEREVIEAELASADTVEWQMTARDHQVVMRRYLPDVHDPRYRDEIKSFFATTINQFVNTFRPRIERVIEEV